MSKLTDRELLNQLKIEISEKARPKVLLGNVSERAKNTRKKTVYRIAAIAACIATMVSLTTVATVFGFEEGIMSMFQRLFGKGTVYVQDNISTIGMGSSDKGITVTVQGVAGDDHNAVILFDVVNEKGTPFKGNSVHFGEVTLEVDDKPMKSGNTANRRDPLRLLSYSTGYNDQNIHDNKVSYVMNVESEKNLQNKEASLTIKGMEYREPTLKEATFDVAGYLQSKDKVESQMVSNSQKKAWHVETYIPYGDKGFFANGEDVPAPGTILENQGINQPLIGDVEGLLVDSIGFVDGKLHIRMDNNYGGGHLVLYMFEKATNRMAPVVFWGESKDDGDHWKDDRDGWYMYYVFDIEDINALNGYKLMAEYYGETKKIDGLWKVDFKLGYHYDGKSVSPPVEMQSVSNELELTDVKASCIATVLNFKWKDGPKPENTYKVAVQLKNGQYIQMRGVSYSNGEKGYRFSCNYSPVDINEIESIIVTKEK